MPDTISPIQIAYFKFALIAPIIQDLYPDDSQSAYFRRITAEPITRPDGTSFKYNPGTIQKWVSQYRLSGMDGLMPKTRSDKGTTRVLDDSCIEEIYRIKEKFPKVNSVMIHTMLIENGFITSDISVRAVQRFVKANDLKSARNPNVKDRKAFEETEFGRMWQSDTCYFPYITENGQNRRTYLIMIIDDHSRMIVGGEIFYHDNASNYQKVLKDAVMTYGIPHKLYCDNGAPYSNDQLSLICGSLGCVLLHTPVRDGAAKGKVERNFRTLKERWLNTLDTENIHSLAEFNELLKAYIRRHNTTVHSSTKETPVDRFLKTRDSIRAPESAEWVEECFKNRITRKVNNASCISIGGDYYDSPQQFIGMRVEIRFVPDHMDEAYIFYENHRYPIHKTDKNANCMTKRDNHSANMKFSQ